MSFQSSIAFLWSKPYSPKKVVTKNNNDFKFNQTGKNKEKLKPLTLKEEIKQKIAEEIELGKGIRKTHKINGGIQDYYTYTNTNYTTPAPEINTEPKKDFGKDEDFKSEEKILEIINNNGWQGADLSKDFNDIGAATENLNSKEKENFKNFLIKLKAITGKTPNPGESIIDFIRRCTTKPSILKNITESTNVNRKNTNPDNINVNKKSPFMPNIPSKEADSEKKEQEKIETKTKDTLKDNDEIPKITKNEEILNTLVDGATVEYQGKEYKLGLPPKHYGRKVYRLFTGKINKSGMKISKEIPEEKFLFALTSGKIKIKN
jgi:hypothetical protein